MASTQPVDRGDRTTASHPIQGLSRCALRSAVPVYPAIRPWHDESTVGGAMASMKLGRLGRDTIAPSLLDLDAARHARALRNIGWGPRRRG
jgi:hypothetical protein